VQTEEAANFGELVGTRAVLMRSSKNAKSPPLGDIARSLLSHL
jgi:hypothetical protein